ncbi:hypothetical protein F2P56_020956 [Juglans regia]|uniref:glucan endo-1,3-beta-D-glucosidase n=1 Tax=Juglans regia TaxID=51240 RepID=A0A833X5V7_JUGRE|nr:hypothetical protein F2P56_020956 [Juglans regia]
MAKLRVSYLLLLLSISAFSDGGSIGINYGRVANNLPPPSKVVELLKSQGFNRVKLYDTDSEVLTALANSGISVTVALPNGLLSSTAADQSFADNWVQTNIYQFYPATKIEAICVGNEVFADPNNMTKFLVPAMKNIHASLAKYSLDSAIKISSPVALTVLQSSYPSSSGSFKSELVEPVMKPMLDLLRQTGSYFMVNVYPFFAYTANSNDISLDYTLFKQNPGVVDSGNGLRYNSLFDAQVDAVFAALSALKYDDVKIVVTETGCPHWVIRTRLVQAMTMRPRIMVIWYAGSSPAVEPPYDHRINLTFFSSPCSTRMKKRVPHRRGTLAYFTPVSRRYTTYP